MADACGDFGDVADAVASVAELRRRLPGLQAAELVTADGKGGVNVVNFSQGPIGRGVFEPGWRWATEP